MAGSSGGGALEKALNPGANYNYCRCTSGERCREVTTSGAAGTAAWVVAITTF